jgi:Ca2+/Na+ antiporter
MGLVLLIVSSCILVWGAVAPEVFNRDVLVVTTLTLSLFSICYGFRNAGHINRIKGAVWLTSYLAYMGYLIVTEFGSWTQSCKTANPAQLNAGQVTSHRFSTWSRG